MIRTATEDLAIWLGDIVMPAMLIVVLIALPLLIITAVVCGIHAWLYPSPTVTLSKVEWACTSAYEEEYFNGKFWQTRTSCARYERIGK